nr:hypothetical protein [Amycolatopsis pretoriensis]
MTRFVTTVMGIVIGLTFLFGFGNVLALALRIGVPAYVAPLIAPALDLTVLGLLVGTRHLAMHGASEAVLRPARRLLLTASIATLALNVADPLCAGHWGKASFDAVGPLLLIGWAEVGPELLRGLQATGAPLKILETVERETAVETEEQNKPCRQGNPATVNSASNLNQGMNREELERARSLNHEHWRAHKRPISAETLRRKLGVGAAKSRRLCAIVRKEPASAITWPG